MSLSENGAHATISPPSGQAVTGSDGVATFTATDTSQEAVSFTATDVTDGNLPVPGSATVNFAPAGPPNCARRCRRDPADSRCRRSPRGWARTSNRGDATRAASRSRPRRATVRRRRCSTHRGTSMFLITSTATSTGSARRAGWPQWATALPDTSFTPNGQLTAIAFGKNGELWAALGETNGDVTQPELRAIGPQHRSGRARRRHARGRVQLLPAIQCGGRSALGGCVRRR